MHAGRREQMAEATRLTRLGRLKEAMDVLRDGIRPDTVTVRPSNGSTATQQRRPLPQEGARSTRSLFERLRRALPGTLRTPHQPQPLRPGREPPVVPPEGPGRFEWHTHRGRSGSRRYRLFVPGGHTGRALPVLVMLHGCKQDPDDFAAGTRMNELAQTHGLLVAYPEQPGHANTGRCWNWFNPADQQRDRGEPELIVGITREIVQQHGAAADRDRIYVAGLSAGGAAAAVLAAEYPDLFAAAGVHSGLAHGAARDVPTALQAMRSATQSPAAGFAASAHSAPLIVFHGDRDRTVNPLNAQHVVAQATRSLPELGVYSERGQSDGGIDYTRSVHRDHGGQARVEQWLLHGCGHAWSGGDRAGSYTEPRGPDASAEMLRFFGMHALR